jgi:hypothetical protein
MRSSNSPIRRFLAPAAIALAPAVSCPLAPVAPIALALAAGAAIAASAAASDITKVEPYFVVVTRDNIPMRADAGPIYYAVRVLKTGDVLRVDGEGGDGGGWRRVEYTQGMVANVPASQVSAATDARTVTLRQPSRLMAANVERLAPWWPLFPEGGELPAGTVLTVQEIVTGPNKEVEAYLVDAPPAARGYVRAEHVRKATDTEVANYKPIAGAAPATPPAAVTPPPAVATPTPAPSTPTPGAAAPVTSVTPDATTPSATAPTATAAAPTPTGADPAAAAAGTPAAPSPGITVVAPGQPLPGAGDPAAAGTSPVAAPAAATPAPTPPPAPDPRQRRIADWDTLRGLWANVMSKRADTTELNTLIAEFNRTIASMGSSPEDVVISNALRERVRALELRRDIIDSVAANQAGQGAITDAQARVSRLVLEAEKQGVYAIVGRMLPSNVYDGRRGMPLMYRIESADSSSTRTVGYVTADEGVDLLTKLGKVVGIQGDSRFDEGLRLQIVRARRVTVLTPTSVIELQGGIPQPDNTVQPTPSDPTADPAGNPVPEQPAEPTQPAQPLDIPPTEPPPPPGR